MGSNTNIARLCCKALWVRCNTVIVLAQPSSVRTGAAPGINAPLKGKSKWSAEKLSALHGGRQHSGARGEDSRPGEEEEEEVEEVQNISWVSITLFSCAFWSMASEKGEGNARMKWINKNHLNRRKCSKLVWGGGGVYSGNKFRGPWFLQSGNFERNLPNWPVKN